MSIKKKILWVLPKYTFPINDGARVASSSLLISITKNSVDVDLMVLSDTNSVDASLFYKQWPINNCFFIDRPFFSNKVAKLLFWLKNFLFHPFTAITLSYFNSRNSKQQIEHILSKHNYDYIVLDGLHSWQSLKELRGVKADVIYRAHNVERDLWFTAAEKSHNYFLSLFYRFQGRLIEDLERDLVESSSLLWAIAEEDLIRFQELYQVAASDVVPVGMGFSKFTARQFSTPIKLFFLGRLDWPPNRDGIRWFLEKIYPHLSAEQFELHIAGSGDGSWIQSYQENLHFTFHGRVEDLDETYHQMDVAIMPIFFGSGTRIKVIESVQQGLPIISTTMGVQGSGLDKDCFILANTEQEWIEKLNNLNINELNNMAQRAWELLRDTLDYNVIAKKISTTLKVDYIE